MRLEVADVGIGQEAGDDLLEPTPVHEIRVDHHVLAVDAQSEIGRTRSASGISSTRSHAVSAPSRFDGLDHALDLVGGQIVHHDDVARRERGCQELLDIGAEEFAVQPYHSSDMS